MEPTEKINSEDGLDGITVKNIKTAEKMELSISCLLQ